MKHTFRSFALLALALALSAAPAFAADWVRIVGMNPASPATLAGVPPATPMGPGNSIEIAFTYNLETQATGRIGFYTAGEAANPPHTGVEIPFAVAKKGQGEGKTRISVQCPQGFEGCTIKTIRVEFFHDAPPAPPTRLVPSSNVAVDYTFKCRPAGGPPTGGPNDKKPNITSARPGLYVWGSDPAKKHWVDWNHDVKLTAAESIHPKDGNGRCAFNVEYYEKETNGVATAAFKNKIFSDADVRAINGPDTLTASQIKPVTTQPYLDPGAHSMKLVLDSEDNVNETSEADNSFAIRYFLEGHCGGTPSTVPGAAAPK
jgi:hypothetical protein